MEYSRNHVLFFLYFFMLFPFFTGCWDLHSESSSSLEELHSNSGSWDRYLGTLSIKVKTASTIFLSKDKIPCFL